MVYYQMFLISIKFWNLAKFDIFPNHDIGINFYSYMYESGIRPRLYGFKGINRQKGHYFIKLSDKGTGRAHNSIYETFILNKLVKRKLVKLIS